MRDLIVTENITLDGMIEATEGWFDPAGGEDAVSDVETALRKQREAADALLLGRVTFEQMRGYWPLQTDDTTGITDYLNETAFAARALRTGSGGTDVPQREVLQRDEADEPGSVTVSMLAPPLNQQRAAAGRHEVGQGPVALLLRA